MGDIFGSKGIAFTLLLGLLTTGIEGYSFTQSNGFSLTPYLEKCGGVIYAKCDKSDLNQETIFEDAREKAIAKNLDLMVVIGADWCPACKSFSKMLKEDSNRDLLFNQVVFVELNGDVSSTRKLAEKLGISYYAYPQAFTFRADTLEFQKSFYPSMMSDVASLIDALDLKKTMDSNIAKPEYVGSVQTKTLELPIDLNNDYGRSYFIPSPKNDYDRFINQGISALHLFQYVDAYRSFRMAEQKDPNGVIAHVGQILSIMQVGYGESSYYFIRDSLKKLNRIKSENQLTRKDLAWIDVAKALSFSSASSYTKEDMEGVLTPVRAIMQLRMIDDKENLDGISLLLWLHPSGFDHPQRKRAFEEALAKYPDSVGPRHYLLHLAESRNNPRDADKHGSILKDLAPGSGHAVHMYGHTLPQKGQWKEAIDYFTKAHAIHINWAQKYGVSPTEDWHYGHNLDLMAAAYLGYGDMDKAFDIWMSAVNLDYRALLHAVQLAVVKEDQGNTQTLTQTLSYYGGEYKVLADSLNKELNLNARSLRQSDIEVITAKGSTFDQLMKEMMMSYLSRTAVKESYYSRVNDYFSAQFPAGGFDGWSNGYLELLRLKRVARLLSIKEFDIEIRPLEFAITSGSLCGSGEKAKSQVKCLPE